MFNLNRQFDPKAPVDSLYAETELGLAAIHAMFTQLGVASTYLRGFGDGWFYADASEQIILLCNGNWAIGRRKGGVWQRLVYRNLASRKFLGKDGLPTDAPSSSTSMEALTCAPKLLLELPKKYGFKDMLALFGF